MPILNHIINKTLCLKSYTLSIGHCNAIADSLHYFEGQLNRIVLDNCGVDDGEFCSMLNGIYKLDGFKRLIYRRNTFQDKSLAILQNIVLKKIPNHLEELRIEQCFTEPNVIRSLLQSITKRCVIKKLGLVDARLNHNIVEKHICELVLRSSFLEELDISQNQLTLIDL